MATTSTRRQFHLALASMATLAWSQARPAMAATWPCWRGANRDGMCGTRLPGKLGTLTPSWSVELGDSYSGPIVLDNHVLVTETVGKQDESLIALDRSSGKQIWKKQWAGAMSVPFFAKSNGDWIRSTPATDGRHIVLGGMCDVVACFDVATGDEKWRVDFPKQHGVELPSFGLVCSPLIDGEYVYVHAGGGIRQIRLADGQLGWLAMKEEGGMMGGAFSSPVIAELGGVRQLVAATRTAMVGIDLASGKRLWFREIQTFRGMNILTPTIWQQQVISSSYGGKSQAIAIKPTVGDWETSLVWEGKSEAYMSSPVVVGDFAYLHLKNQRFCCLNLKTGEETWRTQPFGKYWSMVSDGEKLLALDEVGKLYLIAANPAKFELLDEASVSDEPCWAHLAVADRELFIRTQRSLKQFSLPA